MGPCILTTLLVVLLTARHRLFIPVWSGVCIPRVDLKSVRYDITSWIKPATYIREYHRRQPELTFGHGSHRAPRVGVDGVQNKLFGRRAASLSVFLPKKQFLFERGTYNVNCTS